MNKNQFETLLSIILAGLIIINEILIGENGFTKVVIPILVLITILSYIFTTKLNNVILTNVLLSMFVVVSASSTLFQWDCEFKKDKKECNILLPSSNHFVSYEYDLYRIIYFTVLLLIMTLSLKMTKLNNYDNMLIYILVILFPIIIPLLTELINYLIILTDSGKFRKY